MTAISYSKGGVRMQKWSAEKANEWYQKTPWPVGFNYVTDTATNSTDMWQAADFDAPSVSRSMDAAKEIGYNVVRVFLPFIVWEAEREVFLKTLDQFLGICWERGLQTVPILFDDCAFDDYGDGDPATLFFEGRRDPFLGKQMEPKWGVNNARWTPSPGFRNADDPARQPALHDYVTSVIGTFAHDERILFWDLYNEPDQAGRGLLALPLLVNAFRWAREVNPDQPITAGVWYDGDGPVYRTCLELSDIITFHSYYPLEMVQKHVNEKLSKYERPIIITEWLDRPDGSVVETLLPYFFENKIGCIQWGLWPGRVQDNLCYATMGKNGVPNADPEVWQHCVLHPDGTPYRDEEIALFIELIRKSQA